MTGLTKGQVSLVWLRLGPEVPPMQGEGASLGHDDDAVDGSRVEPKYHVCFPKSSEVFAEAVRISLIMRLSYCNEGIMSPWAANISSVSFQISSMDSSAAV